VHKIEEQGIAMKAHFICSPLLLLLVLPDIHSRLHAEIPLADQRAMTQHGKTRFTVLTPRLIRLEWAEDGVFEDRASLTMVNRHLPVPEFTVHRNADTLSLHTSALDVRACSATSCFDGKNLKITFRTGGREETWFPGKPNPGNLRGTTRTLDGTDGEFFTKDSSHVEFEPGVLSRDGWVLIDDSDRPVLDNSEWQWVTSRPSGKRQDFYFFAYGNDYRTGLKDFASIAGKIPMPPRFAFGYWYSRWRASSDMELRELVNTFNSLDIPLDVLVVDMDWHITHQPEFFRGDMRLKDQAGQDCGWTGFTWDTSLFPDPEGFLAWTDSQGLRTCLNLHPASGFQPHEAQYPAMARAMGIDPATRKYVPFDIVNKRFAEKYFELALHPIEREGVDFWWLDWQQWNSTSIPGVNPTFYLNYVHFTDMARQHSKRPLIYHRWGGLGNHRYQIGFSGDTKTTWASLAFQPYFTATSANVGFGYWGNDIGGFFGTPNTPENFLRWFQFGVFSPILKTHATSKDFAILRKIWEYPPDVFLKLRELIRLRYALIPYLYSSARNAFDTGVSPCHPLYYDYPDAEEAYAFRNEYFFGPDIIVNPITHPIGNDSLFTIQKTWLPPGTWIEWLTGRVLGGDSIYALPYRLEDIPAFVRAGAVIPMQPRRLRSDPAKTDTLILTVFPGSEGSTRIYEDEGNTDAYLDSAFAFTPVHNAQHGCSTTITIDPIEGSYPGMPASRPIEIRLPGTFPAILVTLNGKIISDRSDSVATSWFYDPDGLVTVIRLPGMPVDERNVLSVSFPDADGHLLNGAKRKMDILFNLSKFLSDKRNFRRQELWSDAKYPSDILMRAAQVPIRIGKNPSSAPEELRSLQMAWNEIAGILRTVAKEKPVFMPYARLLEAGE
jgi:alpha-glucosidase (family GH31 glycosyl hydrolase)